MAQEEIIFKVGVDTGTAKNDIDKVGDSVENVGKETKKTAGSFTSLRKELKDLTIQLQNLDPASKEFEMVAQRAGQIKEQMRGVADAINDADPEVFGGKFQRTAEGIAGAFSAVTGAQALFGQQSEEIEKQMLKVQGAIALTQGISAMKELKNDALDLATSIKTKVIGAVTSLTGAELANAEATGTMTTLQKVYTAVVGTSTGALKAFKIALATTGIGLLVVGLGLLISKMMDYFKSTEEIIKQNERLFNSNNKIIAQIGKRREKIDEDMNKQLAYAEAMGKSDEDLYNIKKKFSDKSIKANNDEIQVRLDNVRKLKEIDLGQQASSKEQYLELVKANKQKIVAEWERINELKKINSKANDDVKIAQIKLNNETKQEQQKSNEDAINKQKERNAKLKEQREKEAQERLVLQRRLEDLTVANIDDVNTREIMALKLKHDREREELVKQYEGKKALKEKYDALMLELDVQQENERAELKKQQDDAQAEKDKAKQEKENLNKRSQLEAELIRAEEDFNLKQQKRIELENLDYEQKKANTELTSGELELLKANHEKNLLDISKDSTDRQKMLDEELANSKKFLLDETANMFGALAGLSEQGSAVQKAFAITQLSIDTAKAISSTIAGASAAAAAGGPAAPFLLAGYVASGIATVTKAMSSAKQILNAPMPSVQPPQINRPTEQTQNNATQGAQTEIQAQSAYKVVVVDSDITKMQEKTKKTELISTI
jgi:hypothetical protein